MEIDPQLVGARAQGLRLRPTLGNTYDLFLIIGLALLQLILFVAPSTWLRVPVGLVLSLFAPGYALTAVLFPRRLNHDGLIRVALSIGLSAALLPPLVWLLDALPWGIRPWPIALSLSLLIFVLSIIAMWQRWSLVPSPQTYLPPPVNLTRLRDALSQHSKTKLIIGAAAIIGSAAIIASVLLVIPSAPDTATHVTEFYVLGQGGLAESYPRTATVGKELTLTVGIVNREVEPQTYRIEAWAVNGLNRNERTLLAKRDSITLFPEYYTQTPVMLSMPWSGDDQTIEFLLFIGDKPEPYRQLRLWLNVTESVPASKRLWITIS